MPLSTLNRPEGVRGTGIIAAALLASTATAVGATITVGPSGEADFFLIQDAVNAATDGDEIVVYPGIYSAAVGRKSQVVDLLGKSITLRSCEGPESTIIDGLYVARGIVTTASAGGGATIEGFTIRHGVNGPIDVNGDLKVLAWESHNGGGLYNNSGAPTVHNSRFESNLAQEGAGLGSELGTVDVGGSVFCDNRNLSGDLRNIDGDWLDLGGNTFSAVCVDVGCPTDFNLNGETEVDDLLWAVDQWGPCKDPTDCPTDLNGNGVTDVIDIMAVVAAWGPCPATP